MPSAAAHLEPAGQQRSRGRAPSAFGRLRKRLLLRLMRRSARRTTFRSCSSLALRHRLAVVEALRRTRSRSSAGSRRRPRSRRLPTTTFLPSSWASATIERRITEPVPFCAARLQERAVDLDGVEGELVEIGERGIAGAEVVEREAGARRPPAARSTARRLLRVLHDQRFGDLEPQRALGDDGAAEDVAHLVDRAPAGTAAGSRR